MPEKPDCHKCVHRRDVPGDCHSRCNNVNAKVTGHVHGIKSGWFMWPFNFDPVWLVECDGFSSSKEDDLPEAKHDPLAEIISLMSRRLK